jgi:mRNA interferase MazF
VIKPTIENRLHSRSQIMTDKITAVRRDRVRSVLGRVEPADVERLEQAILVVLGLTQ